MTQGRPPLAADDDPLHLTGRRRAGKGIGNHRRQRRSRMPETVVADAQAILPIQKACHRNRSPKDSAIRIDKTDRFVETFECALRRFKAFDGTPSAQADGMLDTFLELPDRLAAQQFRTLLVRRLALEADRGRILRALLDEEGDQPLRRLEQGAIDPHDSRSGIAEDVRFIELRLGNLLIEVEPGAAVLCDNDARSFFGIVRHPGPPFDLRSEPSEQHIALGRQGLVGGEEDLRIRRVAKAFGRYGIEVHASHLQGQT